MLSPGKCRSGIQGPQLQRIELGGCDVAVVSSLPERHSSLQRCGMTVLLHRQYPRAMTRARGCANFGCTQMQQSGMLKTSAVL